MGDPGAGARAAAAGGGCGRGPGDNAARTPFVLLVVVLLAGGLIALLVLNSALNQGSFRLSELQKETTRLTDEEQALQQEVDEFSDPAELADRARELGMVPGTNPAFLGPGGKVLGVPATASAPPAPSPSAVPSATGSAGPGEPPARPGPGTGPAGRTGPEGGSSPPAPPVPGPSANAPAPGTAGQPSPSPSPSSAAAPGTRSSGPPAVPGTSPSDRTGSTGRESYAPRR